MKNKEKIHKEIKQSSSGNSFEVGERCPSCNLLKFYSIEYDAYYCVKCNRWLESKCKDLKCEFCSKRPDKPLSKNVIELILALSDKDMNKRKEAAIKLRENAEKGFDISYALPSLLKLLGNKNSEDILYDYVYTNPDEISDYEKHLDIYEFYLTLRKFIGLDKGNCEVVLEFIEENKINKNLWWVKELIDSK